MIHPRRTRVKKDSSFSVVLSSMIGAAIGSLIALQVSAPFWFIGLIVGGLVGFLSYEWKKVLSSIPKAYKNARTAQMKSLRASLRLVYSEAMLAFFVCLNVFVLLLPVYGLIFAHTDLIVTEHPTQSYLFFALYGTIAFSLMSAVTTSLCLIGNHEITEQFIALNKKYLNYWAPHKMIVQHLPSGFYRLVQFLARFFHELAIRINSERRLICGVSALLGAGFGYYANNPLIGATAGGALGLFFFEVVSKRLLHLRAR